MFCNEKWVELSTCAQKWDNFQTFFKPCHILHCQHDSASLRTHQSSGIESQMANYQLWFYLQTAKCKKWHMTTAEFIQQLIRPYHWHVFTWIWETCLAWYRQVVITGREMGADRNLKNLIIKSVDYLNSTKMLILSTELFSVRTQSVVFLTLCITFHIGLPTCHT